jgi:hypothetical protein
MAGSPTITKREVNEMMCDALRRRDDPERIPFFCECNDMSCYQAVWLTVTEYDRARTSPRWMPLAAGHHGGLHTPMASR